MSRKFSQVPLNIWRNPAFRALPDDAMLATLFYWAGPHSISAGVSVVPDAYAAADLGWTPDKWQQAREAVEVAGLIRRDDVTETVLVVGYLAANCPSNPRHRAAVVSQISNLECDELRQVAEAEFARIDTRAEATDAAKAPVTDLSPALRARQSQWRGAA